jgi:hypothetical protein
LGAAAVTLSPPTAVKVAKLVRLLASDRDGEVLAVVEALKRTLDLHALADVIEKPEGLTEAEMRRLYDAGFAAGLRKAEDAAHGNDVFRSVDGSSSWNEIACFCAERIGELDRKHHAFIRDMTSKTLWRKPTPKQGRYLKSLFFQLGGKPRAAPA